MILGVQKNLEGEIFRDTLTHLETAKTLERVDEGPDPCPEVPSKINKKSHSTDSRHSGLKRQCLFEHEVLIDVKCFFAHP